MTLQIQAQMLSTGLAHGVCDCPVTSTTPCCPGPGWSRMAVAGMSPRAIFAQGFQERDHTGARSMEAQATTVMKLFLTHSIGQSKSRGHPDSRGGEICLIGEAANSHCTEPEVQGRKTCTMFTICYGMSQTLQRSHVVISDSPKQPSENSTGIIIPSLYIVANEDQ